MKQIQLVERRSIGERLTSFGKRCRWALQTLAFGGAVMLLGRMFQSAPSEVLSNVVTVLNYVAYFSILIGCLALCAKMERKRVSSVFAFAATILTIGGLCFFLFAVPPAKQGGLLDSDYTMNQSIEPAYDAIYHTTATISGLRTSNDQPRGALASVEQR